MQARARNKSMRNKRRPSCVSCCAATTKCAHSPRTSFLWKFTARECDIRVCMCICLSLFVCLFVYSTLAIKAPTQESDPQQRNYATARVAQRHRSLWARARAIKFCANLHSRSKPKHTPPHWPASGAQTINSLWPHVTRVHHKNNAPKVAAVA